MLEIVNLPFYGVYFFHSFIHLFRVLEVSTFYMGEFYFIAHSVTLSPNNRVSSNSCFVYSFVLHTEDTRRLLAASAPRG